MRQIQRGLSVAEIERTSFCQMSEKRTSLEQKTDSLYFLVNQVPSFHYLIKNETQVS